MTRQEFIKSEKQIGATVTLSNGKEYTLIYVAKKDKHSAILYSLEYDSYFWINYNAVVAIDNDRIVYLEESVKERTKPLFRL